jgi:drug/metabolite transporter (DMT)-like permease
MVATTTPTIGLGSQAWNFARHFIEMCAAMCLGGSVLYAAFVALADALGSPNLRADAPELAVAATAVIYALPMAMWMVFRGMDRRSTVEMTAATLAVGAVFIGAAAVGFITAAELSAWASARFCLPACAVMVAVMLVRRDVYTGRTGHHMAHSAQAA